MPWPLANLNSGPGCFGGWSIRCLLTPPLGWCRDSLWTKSLGRMLGYVGWHVWLLLRSLGVQGSSQQPHDLPTFPRPSAQGLSPQGVCCILPRGVSSEPWCFCPLMQPGPKFQFTRGQGTRERTLHNALGLTVGLDIFHKSCFKQVFSCLNLTF